MTLIAEPPAPDIILPLTGSIASPFAPKTEPLYPPLNPFELTSILPPDCTFRVPSTWSRSPASKRWVWVTTPPDWMVMFPFTVIWPLAISVPPEVTVILSNVVSTLIVTVVETVKSPGKTRSGRQHVRIIAQNNFMKQTFFINFPPFLSVF